VGATSSSTSKTGASSEVASTTPSSTDISTRITEWRLSDSEIQADLDRGVAIVRTKDSVVGAPTGNTDDSVVETMVKGKLQADSETGKAMIDVKAKNGEVTLDGSADSAKLVGRAIALALDTQGVSKVTANVKVNPKSVN
jgi:osmotically-inducible protein OsmY